MDWAALEHIPKLVLKKHKLYVKLQIQDNKYKNEEEIKGSKVPVLSTRMVSGIKSTSPSYYTTTQMEA